MHPKVGKRLVDGSPTRRYLQSRLSWDHQCKRTLSCCQVALPEQVGGSCPYPQFCIFAPERNEGRNFRSWCWLCWEAVWWENSAILQMRRGGGERKSFISIFWRQMYYFQVDSFPAWTQFSFLSGESLQKSPFAHCLLCVKDIFHWGMRPPQGQDWEIYFFPSLIKKATEAVTEPHPVLCWGTTDSWQPRRGACLLPPNN